MLEQQAEDGELLVVVADDSWPTDLHFPQSGFFQNL
jgi:hypothetical protein